MVDWENGGILGRDFKLAEKIVVLILNCMKLHVHRLIIFILYFFSEVAILLQDQKYCDRGTAGENNWDFPLVY